MFSNATIAFLLAVGFGAWVYAKIQRQTGGNTQSSLIVSGATALLTFIAAVILLGVIF